MITSMISLTYFVIVGNLLFRSWFHYLKIVSRINSDCLAICNQPEETHVGQEPIIMALA